jgi:hypothetical protein
MSPGVSSGASADTADKAPADSAAPSATEVEARVQAQKEAMSRMSEEVTAEEKIACSIDNPDECVACGS